MDTQKIGENAGVVWRTLYNSCSEMNFNQLIAATHLEIVEIAAAIGWLAREAKIQTRATNEGYLFAVYKECYY